LSDAEVSLMRLDELQAEIQGAWGKSGSGTRMELAG